MQGIDLAFRLMEDARLDPPALTPEQERKARLYAERGELERRLAEIADELWEMGEAL